VLPQDGRDPRLEAHGRGRGGQLRGAAEDSPGGEGVESESSGQLQWLLMANIGEAIRAYAPVVVTLVGSVPVTFLFTRWKTRRDLLRSADSVAVRRFIRTAPTFREISEFYKELDMKNAFIPDVHDQFYEAVQETLADPLRSFHSTDLQAKFKVLFDKCHELELLMTSDTFAVPHDQRRQTIRRKKYQSSEDDFATGDRLNALATQVYEMYEAFLRHAKRVCILDAHSSGDVGAPRPVEGASDKG